MHPFLCSVAQTVVRIQISDTAPGSGLSRENYLSGRILRLVEPHAKRIEAVELAVSFDDSNYEAALSIRFHGESPAHFRCKSRRMVNALGSLFDSVESRLGIQFPKVRSRHDEAM